MWIDTRGSTVLPAPECKRLLAVAAKDERVGRVGISTDSAPLVVPVNFALLEGHVLAQVGAGTLTRAAEGHLVAFEVDHVDPGAGTAWSVLVRGFATVTGAPTETQRSMKPYPLVPEPGELVLSIRLDVVTGRSFKVRRPSHAAHA
jgi:nitroimidazol reductase NimA-like FMN-containing flavoprotein (pyridoxamine 5'-phosphate oxidase superfamily)